MDTNSVLTSVALLERVRPMLNIDKRDQLTRQNLETIRNILNRVINNLKDHEQYFKNVTIYVAGAYALIDDILADSEFSVTDTETKELVSKNILQACDNIYVPTGKFYFENNRFDHSMGLDPILERVVDRCIADGFYFGLA